MHADFKNELEGICALLTAGWDEILDALNIRPPYQIPPPIKPAPPAPAFVDEDPPLRRPPEVSSNNNPPDFFPDFF